MDTKSGRSISVRKGTFVGTAAKVLRCFGNRFDILAKNLAEFNLAAGLFNSQSVKSNSLPNFSAIRYITWLHTTGLKICDVCATDHMTRVFPPIFA